MDNHKTFMNQKYIITAAYYLAFILLGLTIAAEGPTLLQLAENTSSALDRLARYLSSVHWAIFQAHTLVGECMTAFLVINLWQQSWFYLALLLPLYLS
jgi:hypothetical protein